MPNHLPVLMTVLLRAPGLSSNKAGEILKMGQAGKNTIAKGSRPAAPWKVRNR